MHKGGNFKAITGKRCNMHIEIKIAPTRDFPKQQRKPKDSRTIPQTSEKGNCHPRMR